MYCFTRAAVWLAVSFTLALPLSTAHAWGIGSQLDYSGCHETITAEALRRTRATVSTAPVIVPTRDEAALIDGVQFSPPTDMLRDLGGMALLLAVRDNDLKGENPLDTLMLVRIHGDPGTQEEHCIRNLEDDDSEGNITALERCRAFIRDKAIEALDGLDASGAVDPTLRTPLQIHVSFAGRVIPKLPLFYVRMGQAIHALQDGFTHTFRTPDGMNVTVVLNYIDYVRSGSSNIGRDGPNHLGALDNCDNADVTIGRNERLSIEASTELLKVALDPARTRDQKIAGFEAVTAKYLTYKEAGCTLENNWCDAIEAEVADEAGCDASGRGTTPWSLIVLVAGALLLITRKRNTAHAAALALVFVISTSASAYADDPPSPPPAPPVGDAKPAIKVEPKTADDAKSAAEGTEPGRDESTPTIKEVKSVREDKRLGHVWGFAGSIGGSVISGAGVVAAGVRYRISEKWIAGFNVQWNPWITSVPLTARAGSLNVYATLIRRFPMRFDRVNLRTSFHLGASMLLFDVVGAPTYSVGPYVAFTPLGIDYDLGGSVRIVIDPVEIAMPMPYVGQIPLYYEQFRLMVGIQIGA
ncbi:MAG: hypothetical protein H0T46_00785 [Deltaproteobacteria bacterium]|nr:hypothetical protein [Deltaproteobacteria bacterium]